MLKPVRDFQLLYNPEGAAKVKWRNWEDGYYNLNFPTGVVKSDDDCNLMIGRYHDR